MFLTADRKQQHAERAQTCLSARHAAQRKEKDLRVQPINQADHVALTNICNTLQQLAQKYVPNTTRTFSDYAELARCVKLLHELGSRVPLRPNIAAHVDDVDATVVVNSPAYRQTRNKCIACLATIADLTEKTTASGSAEYRRGMREGYRRASEIACSFLRDFNAGDVV